MVRCNSCGKDVVSDPHSVKFSCPECGKEIIRCSNCRSNATKYKCHSCKFEGP